MTERENEHGGTKQSQNVMTGSHASLLVLYVGARNISTTEEREVMSKAANNNYQLFWQIFPFVY